MKRSYPWSRPFRAWTISSKLLALIGSMVCFAIGSYLILAINLFKDDKISLIYELNLSNVKTLAAEIDADLKKSLDRARLLVQGLDQPQWTEILFDDQQDATRLSIFRAGTLVRELRKPGFAPLDRKAQSMLQPYFEETLRRGTLAWNATTPEHPPIVRVAQSLRVQGAPTIVMMDLSAEGWIKRIMEPSVATRFLVDYDGRVVVHPNPEWVLQATSMKTIPLVQSALQNKIGFQIEQFQWSGETWLGAHAPLKNGGLTVVSQIPTHQAFRAARRLIEKSILLALLILTVALLFSTRLAKSFTDPLKQLVEATRRLSRWELGNLVKVRTHDEIATLATSFNSMTRDLHQQRQQIEAHQRELEDKVRLRTRELAEAQEALVRTTRLASLGELAGAAAHEVLNPVNNMGIRLEKMKGDSHKTSSQDSRLLRDILEGWKGAFESGGWSALEAELKRKPSSTPKATMLEEDMDNLLQVAALQDKRMGDLQTDYAFLHHEMERITKIVNNMRSLARVGGDRRPIDVHDAIEATAKTLDDLLHKKSIQLHTEFTCPRDATHRVLADRDELVQVFSNLLRNAMHAIEHSESSAREIHIRTSASADDKLLEVTIRDTGAGIRPEHVGRIFEPDFTTKSLIEGTGLGLSISRRLVRAFGGDLYLKQSEVGQGTTFLIQLPFVAVSPQVR